MTNGGTTFLMKQLKSILDMMMTIRPQKKKKLERDSKLFAKKKREKCLHQHAEIYEQQQHTDFKCIYAQFTVVDNNK